MAVGFVCFPIRCCALVQETMQPTQVGLWLRPTADHGRPTAAVGGQQSAVVSTERNQP
jgi:hypothetical protein